MGKTSVANERATLVCGAEAYEMNIAE